MSGSNSFGFPGQNFPTQETTNSGVYSQQEIAQLKQHNRFLKKDFTLEFLAIAGGGSGDSGTFGAGGGGAGGYLNSFGTEVSGDSSSNLSDLTASTGVNYYISVGGGGAVATSGTDTVFHNHTAVGGGKGSDRTAGSSGGSGGGGGRNGNGGSGTTDQGNNGGAGYDSGVGGGPFSGGGGGGAANNGGNSGGSGGNGGNGLDSAITGTNVTRGGGGGGFSGDGSGTSNRTAGNGGNGGGGAGGNSAGSGTANTGGGGGASYDAGSTGAGGSGVVILSYPVARTITLDGAGTLVASGGEVTVGSRKYIIIESGAGNVSFA